MRKKTIVLGTAALLVLLLSAWDFAMRPMLGPHGRLELSLLRSADSLPVIIGTYFTTAGRCAGCHGRDLQGIASIDAQGRDVNVVDDWRSTMMANSARDPFFRAKVRHESLVNPAHADSLQNKCLGCHAPLGMHEERLLGHDLFTLAHLDTSRLGMDGVSCLSCHMQSEATAGSFFSGELQFDSARVYGPYSDDQINPAIMQFFVRFTPGFGSHIVNSKVCAGCHTLITETADLEGNLTGDRFVEQATYHEWLNSVYSANGTQCNTCHMPRINDGILLAAEYPFLNPQSPFGLHHLVGGNEHMLRLLKQFKDTLDIPATDLQFDSTITRTQRMLRHHTLDAQLNLLDRTADTAYFALRLENRAGHRFPSGYPSRRAFVEFVVLTTEGDTVFKSGMLNSADEVEGHDAPYEPHHDAITGGDQVQIYELVMGDVNGDVTTVLERARDPIKDNRLAPVGFTSAHYAYDTTRVAGVPVSDIDFNRNAFGEEGTGADVVRYHVPISGVPDALRAFARVWYQPVPPAWNQEMFSHDHPEINTFRDMLEASDRSPSLVAADSLFLGPAGIASPANERIRIAPNPTPDGWITVSADGLTRIEFVAAYDARGSQVAVRTERAGNAWRIQLPVARGTYFVRLRVDGEDLVKRVLRP
ncbi:MAG: T9SS type A sorting domain-containing protein [Flavobacteriales bacterium]|nr:T9SS type A sorting domain-containing protein [Flavobacteriales bacterium]